LVHEAYIKLVDHSHQTWQTRSHFFAVAAKAMRCILVDHAKMHTAEKRGGIQKDIPFTEQLVGSKDQAREILNLDEALSRLEKIAERQSKVIELRFFCGFSIEETAKILDLSPATVKRDWNLARSWLYKEIKRHD
jgi:RNA polymerase sigma factor (TIGR02999 family)